MVMQGRGTSDAESVTSAPPHRRAVRPGSRSGVLVKDTVTAVICAAVLTTPACSSQQTSPPQAQSSQSRGADHNCPSGSKYPPAPTTQQISDRLKVLVDTHVPLEQRVNSVQGAERDPQILDRLAAVLTDAHYNVVIHTIDNYCNGQASANSLVTFKGETNEMQIPLTVADNQWKLNNSWACDLMTNASISSPMCRAG